MFFPPSRPIPIPPSAGSPVFSTTVDDLIIEIIKNRSSITQSTIREIIAILKNNCGVKRVEFRPSTPSDREDAPVRIPRFLGLK